MSKTCFGGGEDNLKTWWLSFCLKGGIRRKCRGLFNIKASASHQPIQRWTENDSVWKAQGGGKGRFFFFFISHGRFVFLRKSGHLG